MISIRARTNRKGFTLLEIMIAVAIIALLGTIALPSILRSRKRTQAGVVLNDIRVFNDCINQWMIEDSRAIPLPAGYFNQVADEGFFPRNSRFAEKKFVDSLGNAYEDLDGDGHVALSTATLTEFADVADADFWKTFDVD